MGLLDNLSKFGISNINTDNMFENKVPVSEKKNVEKKEEKPVEDSFLFKKRFTCPVCESEINSLTCKSNSLRMSKLDRDLRPIYVGIDPIKYEPIMCPECGYGAMAKYYTPVTSRQRQAIVDNISRTFDGHVKDEFVVSYEQAVSRIELVLACCIVKGAKASEKAYVCLKGGWICRGYAEAIKAGDEKGDEAKLEELKAKELEFLEAAYDGLISARQSEMFPMAGMDEGTLDYVLAALAFEIGKLDMCSRMLSNILVSSTVSPKLKDKARDLKEELAAKKKADEA